MGALDSMSLPISNVSSGTTTASNTTAKPVAQPTVAKTPASAMTPVPTPVKPVVSTVTKPAPAVITAKPAIAQVQKQTTAVNQATVDVAAQKATSDKAKADAATASAASEAAKAKATADLTTQGAGFVSSDQATRDKVTAMSKQAEGTTSAEAPKATTQASPASVSAYSDPSQKTPEQALTDSLKASDEKAGNALAEYQDSISQIMNGTYPLNDYQKAQLDSITNAYQGLITQQKVANQNYENAIRMTGISSGRSMYAPEIELGNVNAAISAGVASIADINTKMNTALSDARQAIMDNNFKMLDASYKAFNEYEKTRRQTVLDTYEAAKAAMKDAKDNYEAQKKDAADFATLGKDPEEFDPNFFTKMDSQRKSLGFASYDGFSKDLYEANYKDAKKKADLESATSEADLAIKRQSLKTSEQQENLNKIDMLDKVGMNGTVTIGGTTYQYQGYNSNDSVGWNETDDKGNSLYAVVNKRTGEKKVYDMGIRKAQDGWTVVDAGENGIWSVNARTGEQKPFYASQGQQTWDDGEFTQGEVGPALEGSTAKGQCGAMVNYFYGKGVVGNSLQSKLDPLKQYAVTNTSDVRVGMTVVQDIGSNGHIGFVESTGKDLDGREYVTMFESNFDMDGKIDHGRKIYLDDPSIKMISDYPAPKLPGVGSDATPTILTKKETTKATPLSTTEADYWTKNGYTVKPGMTEEDLKAQNPSVTSDVQTKIDKANEIKRIATELLSNKSLGAAVGPISSRTPTLRGGTADFEAELGRLKSMMTIDNMGIMKGVLSDSDIKIIQQVGSSLTTSRSEEGFKKELQRVIDSVSKVNPNAKQLVSPESFGSVQSPDGKTVLDYDLTDPAQKAEYDEALKSGYISI